MEMKHTAYKLLTLHKKSWNKHACDSDTGYIISIIIYFVF